MKKNMARMSMPPRNSPVMIQDWRIQEVTASSGVYWTRIEPVSMGCTSVRKVREPTRSRWVARQMPSSPVCRA